MQETIENLVKLQGVELERARLAQALRALPAEVAQAEAALQGAQRDVTAASDALTREETLRTRLERDTAGHKQKAARLGAQRDSITTAAQADALENEEYASLERTEAQEALLAAARARVETLAGALDQTRENVARRQQEMNAQQTALKADREALRKLIDPDLLARFDRLVTARGTGIARAENQQCTGCRMGVRPQIWNQLREGELLTCDSCSRLLYWDPAMAPAPKEPQPETPANSAAPAIPKPRRVS